MGAPLLLSKLGTKKTLVICAIMMSMISFSSVVIGWRVSLHDVDPNDESGKWKFFYDKLTCKFILAIGNLLAGAG